MIRTYGPLIAGLLLLAALLSACSGAGGTSSAGAAGTPPRIAVDNEVLDYGTLHYNQWARPNIQIRNEGGSNLVIQRPIVVKTLVGC